MTTTTAATSGTSVYDIISKQAQSNSASNSNSSSSTTQTGDDALASLSGDYSNFLTLLTTQLKNQDPLSPMDTTQFTQQLVQFSAVEQQINGNKKLDQLIGLQSTANAYGAVGFVGTEIAADSSDVPLQDGKAKFDYTIDKTGTGAATLKILDASGNIVMLKQVDATVGTHPVEWDGTDYFGNQLSDGKYTVSVSYKDESGKDVDADITTYGKVDQAVIADGSVYLKMGDVSVPLSDVIRISKPTDTPADSGGDDTGDGSDESDPASST